ncbi:zincin-like metallopeptidase domain-containing protein [Mucilaginibacter arboris]|uniref:zincin-like metallopeptidase domain-containing protein n=1 Tax=Mucilaginibacter arboris TaxID=2682090 RepID=UPI0018DBFF77
MPVSPQIYHKSNCTYCKRSNDTIVVLNMQKFDNSAAFYSTLFHELTYRTGHETKLNCKELTESN